MESTTGKLKDNILNGFPIIDTCDRQNIKCFLNSDYGMVFGVDYQESHLAGALAALVKKGKLIATGRGQYKKALEKEQINLEDFEEIKNLVKETVKNECDYLKEITSDMKISLGNLEKSDIKNVLLIKELIEYLENFQLL